MCAKPTTPTSPLLMLNACKVFGKAYLKRYEKSRTKQQGYEDGKFSVQNHILKQGYMDVNNSCRILQLVVMSTNICHDCRLP